VEEVSGISKFVNRVRRSAKARKKNYLTKMRAQYKATRQKYADLGGPAHLIWIMGCQRSGTTHLERIFRSDLDSAVFGEFSELSIHPEVSVWQPLPRVADILAGCNARYAVARPLFESDRMREILNYFPASHALWLFRDCPHVVDSMISKWDDRFFALSGRRETDENGEWRLAGLKAKIESELGPAAPIRDQYALYWLRRNEIPLARGLVGEPRLMFLNYRQLVTRPDYCVDTIMKRCGLQGVWPGFKTDTHAKSLDKPVAHPVSPELLARCESVYSRLSEHAISDFPEATA
jgi:hypothetical protein